MAWLILFTVGVNMVYKVREYGRADIADLLIGIMATFLIYEAL